MTTLQTTEGEIHLIRSKRIVNTIVCVGDTQIQGLKWLFPSEDAAEKAIRSCRPFEDFEYIFKQYGGIVT